MKVGLGSVEQATDFFVSMCSTPSFSLNLRDDKSMSFLDMSGENKELIALDQSKKTEQCFNLVITSENYFVIMNAGKCLRYDYQDTKKFYHENCNQNPTYFNVLFETSIMHGKDLPLSKSKKYSPYTSFVKQRHRRNYENSFFKKNYKKI